MLSFKKNKNDQESQLNLSVEKLALSNTMTIEALVQVLTKKGIVSQQEILEAVREIGEKSKLVPIEKIEKEIEDSEK